MPSSFESHRPVLIIGAGLAGLSAAFHLKKTPCLIVEKETEVGGTARSVSVGGFTFDFTGHLLHLHNDYTRRLIQRLLKNNVYSCVRNTWIFSNDTYTRYPFQANTFGLPDPIIDECVLGFLDSFLNKASGPARYERLDFDSWCEGTFGQGISKHFMAPYNQKLYQTPLNKMTADWCGPFVPKPKLEEVIQGALTSHEGKFGYNTTFLYPKKGGIQVLAQSLARRVKNLAFKTTVVRLDWKKRRAWLSDGREIRYRSLINTIPLVEFLKLMPSLPREIDRARRRLKFASILCLNIGVKRPRISDVSWVYFPQDEFPFYRVGFPMNFTPHAVPRGCSSMYVEIPMNATHGRSKSDILKAVKKGLVKAGILKPRDKFLVTQFLPIRYAYVIYDRRRAQALPKIFKFLRANGIQSIGRYGAWKYSFMEEAILDGKKAAEWIESRAR